MRKECVQEANDNVEERFFCRKLLYRLGGMPHVLNIWMYECCFEVEKVIDTRQSNIISKFFKIFNWSTIEIKLTYKKFMDGMFNKVNLKHNL